MVTSILAIGADWDPSVRLLAAEGISNTSGVMFPQAHTDFTLWSGQGCNILSFRKCNDPASEEIFASTQGCGHQPFWTLEGQTKIA